MLAKDSQVPNAGESCKQKEDRAKERQEGRELRVHATGRGEGASRRKERGGQHRAADVVESTWALAVGRFGQAVVQGIFPGRLPPRRSRRARFDAALGGFWGLSRGLGKRSAALTAAGVLGGGIATPMAAAGCGCCDLARAKWGCGAHTAASGSRPCATPHPA